MSTIFIRNILSTEITSIPTWISAISGEYYNNALCNGATWILVLWKFVHIIYNKMMHVYFKHIGMKQYIRTRLTNSLWYCGFFSSLLTYYLLTFDRNKMELLRGSYVTLNENLPTPVVLVFTVICTFYLHTALSEGIQNGFLCLFVRFMLLVVICVSAYILRLLEVPFTLSALIAISVISEELTKIFHSLLSQDKNMNSIFVGMLYFFHMLLFILTHLVIIPSVFLIPLGKRMFSRGDTILVVLFSSLLLWISAAIYNSIISKSVFHWLYHVTEKDNQEKGYEKSKEKILCPGNIIECSMFPARTDDAYLLYILRSEIKERKIEMEIKKKPKNKNMMLIQTLKCMMAIKKKLNRKKFMNIPDSDDPLETEDNTKDNNPDNTLDVCEEEDEIELGLQNYNDTDDEFRSTTGSKDLQNENSVSTEATTVNTNHCSAFNSKSFQDSTRYVSDSLSEEKANVTEPVNDMGSLEVDKAYKLDDKPMPVVVDIADDESGVENSKRDDACGGFDRDKNKARK